MVQDVSRKHAEKNEHKLTDSDIYEGRLELLEEVLERASDWYEAYQDSMIDERKKAAQALWIAVTTAGDLRAF